MINERAMLVTLNISRWTGRKKDKKVTKETNAFYGAADASGYYSKALIPKEAVKPISQVVSTARTFHYENTLPWGDNGERLLPKLNIAEDPDLERLGEYVTQRLCAVPPNVLRRDPDIRKETADQASAVLRRMDYFMGENAPREAAA